MDEALAAAIAAGTAAVLFTWYAVADSWGRHLRTLQDQYGSKLADAVRNETHMRDEVLRRRYAEYRLNGRTGNVEFTWKDGGK